MTGSRVLALALLALACLPPRPVQAQLPPHADWRTIRTEHFLVHFTPQLEEQARRAATNAEWAYRALAAELRPPRGLVDLVVADNVDFSNGYATPFPSNRIVVYAHPPVDLSSLRFYDDWNRLVIAHELVHIFHLDRAGGWWGALQRVFGRNPVLFPNAYVPAWLTEGIAVYYESRLTGTGRILGSQHRMIARSMALERDLPRLDELSLAAPGFPRGQVAYAYGSLLVEHLARTRGDSGVPRLIEQLGRASIPFRLNAAARDAFGVTFERAWREWRDSVTRSLPARPRDALPGWIDLTTGGWYTLHPRWRNDSTLVYAASTGKETSGAYTVGLDGGVRRIGRRNGLEPNVPLADGGLLYAQLDFVDPYHVRSDLYVQRGGRERRLTRDKRLSHVDVRRDGAMVAVQAAPATTRLVRITADGQGITPITTSAPDTQWAEPRWSPAGDRIAAVRSSGAVYQVVVLDTLGFVQRVLASDRAVAGSPSWSPDGAMLFYTSDRSGASEIYVTAAGGEDTGPHRRLSAAATGLFYPESSPGARLLAAAVYRADGYHIGVAPLSTATAGAEAEGVQVRSAGDTLPPPAPDTRIDAPYSPWRSLLPRYWFPVVEATTGIGTRIGATTSGEDIVGRHSYVAQALLGTRGSGYEAYAAYRYAGLGMPLLDASARHTEDPPLLLDPEQPRVGSYEYDETVVLGAATMVRPRIRTNAWLRVGAELRRTRLELAPDSLHRVLGVRRQRDRRGLFTSAGWSNAQRPPLSISPEDGVALSGLLWRRWTIQGETAPSHEAVGVASAYKSLPGRGYAHHVLALRAAAGWMDERARSAFAIGGVSGTSVPVLGGYDFGDERRTFPVRGFTPGVRRGTRALAGSVEYRAPLALLGRGYRLLPVFLGRTSASAFADAATAWCPAVLEGGAVCSAGDTERVWLASVGAELNADAVALAYDYTYRLRLGAAVPVAGTTFAESDGRAQPVTVYLTVGLSF